MAWSSLAVYILLLTGGVDYISGDDLTARNDNKPTVTTFVAKERPEVTLKCSLPVEYEVRSYLFQDPSRRVIDEDVAEDRYILQGAGTTSNADVKPHECGLRITNPVTADLGIWRCAVQTDNETYYGFLTVLCPWAMQDPATAAAVVSEPTLTAIQPNVLQLESDRMNLFCSIQTAIRSCYFKSSNGTIFNVTPGDDQTSTGFKYIGAGFDAGECNIRFRHVRSTDSGHWSCHVALLDPTQPEQSASIQVRINQEPTLTAIQPTVLQLEGDRMNLFCSIQTAIRSCYFKSSNGTIFNVSPGDDQTSTGFKYIGAGFDAGECNIRFRHVRSTDSGHWSCHVAPLDPTQPEQSASIQVRINQEPTLTAIQPTVLQLEGDRMNLFCSIQTAIRSCYFKSSNGTIFNVTPGDDQTSTGFKYIGAGFDAGECNIRFRHVRSTDSGHWSCHVALLDPTQPEQSASIQVRINQEPTLTAIQPTVLQLEGDRMNLFCSIQTAIRSCYFKSSNGTIFNVSPGDDQTSTGFKYIGAGFDAGECNIRFRHVRSTDSGHWSCHVAPLDPTQPEQSASIQVRINQEPTLTAIQPTVLQLEGDCMNLFCSIQTAIRSCYFKSSNGTIFNVSPGDDQTSTGFKYIGAGFDAGECNIRFRHVRSTDSGRWSCHVALLDPTQPEQSTSIQVRINQEPTLTAIQPTVLQLEGDRMNLFCSIQTAIRSCYFKSSNGTIFNVSPGDDQTSTGFKYIGAGFDAGECNIRFRHVRSTDSGHWSCHVAPLDPTQPEQSASIQVRINQEPTLTAIQPTVLQLEGDRMNLFCSIQTAIRSCYFKSSNGTIFNVTPGDDLPSTGFKYIGAGFDAGECNIRFRHVRSTDSGRWSCHVALMDSTQPEQSAGIEVRINQEPTLTAIQPTVLQLEGDRMNLFCSIQTAIRSCYFKSSNGTIFNVTPGDDSTSTGFKYIGAGFDAGECNIRFRHVRSTDSGRWSCHVALLDSTQPEQSAGIEVRINQEPTLTAIQPTVLQLEGDRMNLFCSIQTAIRSCYFKSSNGTIFNVTPGDDLTSTGFKYIGAGFDAGECNIRFRHVRSTDSGRWSCHVALLDSTQPEQSADIDVRINQEPTLTAIQPTVLQLEGDRMNLFCSIQTAIRSCYFKSSNGTIFNVTPGDDRTSNGFKYIGAGFDAGECNIRFRHVRSTDSGHWSCHVGLLDPTQPEQSASIQVRISQEPTLTAIQPTVLQLEGDRMNLFCSIQTAIRSCYFKSSNGTIFNVTPGDDRTSTGFKYIGAGFDAGECNIRFRHVRSTDSGRWSCHVALVDLIQPEQSADIEVRVNQEPTLTAIQQNVQQLEGDRMNLFCSIQTAIQYCYFRSSNGTIFNVSPGDDRTSTGFKYIGAGFDAGECNIRFRHMRSTDSGLWSCHVGLLDLTQPEQRANIEVQINRTFEVNQYVTNGNLRVEGQVFNNQAVEYCRYVRMDGLGFTSANLPDSRYHSVEDMTRGFCSIKIEKANILEMHPWTVAAKIVGEDHEVFGVSDHTIQMPAQSSNNSYILFWSMLTVVGVLLFIIGFLLIPRSHRYRTFERASALRDSIRKSFRLEKAPLPADNDTRSTPMSA